MTTASAHAAGASFNQALRQGLIAGGTAMAFNGAGDIYQANEFMGYVAHAGVGCVSSVAGGGNCGQGAVSAVFGKYTSNTINGWGGNNVQGIIARGVATSVAGGVGSVIAGGKFANGAETAAYGYLFNEVLTTQNGTKFKSSGKYYSGVETLDDARHTLYRDALSAGEIKIIGEGIKLITMANPIGRGVLTIIDGITIVDAVQNQKYDDALTTGFSAAISEAMGSATRSAVVSAYSGWVFEKATTTSSWFAPYGNQRNPHAPSQ